MTAVRRSVRQASGKKAAQEAETKLETVEDEVIFQCDVMRFDMHWVRCHRGVRLCLNRTPLLSESRPDRSQNSPRLLASARMVTYFLLRPATHNINSPLDIVHPESPATVLRKMPKLESCASQVSARTNDSCETCTNIPIHSLSPSQTTGWYNLGPRDGSDTGAPGHECEIVSLLFAPAV